MKPTRNGRACFPKTDYFFKSDLRGWRGPWAGGDDDDSDLRRFSKFNREFLRQCELERKRETVVFSIVIFLAAWPVLYMIASVIQLLLKGRPLDQ